MSNEKNTNTSKELSEKEKAQREKNRQKALKESRNKKNEKIKAKAKKELAKKAEQKANKRARHKEARKSEWESRIKSVKEFFAKNKTAFIIAGVCILALVVFLIALNTGSGNKDTQVVETAKEDKDTKPEETVSEEEADEDEETAKEEEPEDEKRELKKLSARGKDTAASVSANMQDIYPHYGGLYFMPDSNDEESVTGSLMEAIIMKKDEYTELKAGETLNLDGQELMLLTVNDSGEYGTAILMTPYDENEDYEKLIKKGENFEEYFGYDKLIYGTTIKAEESQIGYFGGEDYFANDGYEDDDMIFFTGTALYFPLCSTMDTKVTLYFDEDCKLTVPDETMLTDTDLDYKAYLRGEDPIYPPDIMAAKIETEGDRITKYTVMYVPLEDM